MPNNDDEVNQQILRDAATVSAINARAAIASLRMAAIWGLHAELEFDTLVTALRGLYEEEKQNVERLTEHLVAEHGEGPHPHLRSVPPKPQDGG